VVAMPVYVGCCKKHLLSLGWVTVDILYVTFCEMDLRTYSFWNSNPGHIGKFWKWESNIKWHCFEVVFLFKLFCNLTLWYIQYPTWNCSTPSSCFTPVYFMPFFLNTFSKLNHFLIFSVSFLF
jgi:hypothetical protein